MWQELRTELHPHGLEIVTVALDTGGINAAGRWIEAAKPEHPSLIDEAHVMDELFGVVNVPTGIWIDEEGMIVRPPEPAWPGKIVFAEMMKKRELPADIDPYLVETLKEAARIRPDAARLYAPMLRDWVENGRESRFALSPDEVVRRSRPRPPEVALAAAHFELGQHLHRAGYPKDAVPHFRESHRLQPENWTYKRQAWSFAHPLQAPSDDYDSDWVSEIRKIGAENYYAPLEE